MFDDFQRSTDGQSRKRLQRSLAAAAVIYGSSGAALVAATASVRHAAEEELKQVEFATAPEPPPPPPEPPPPTPKPQSARPKAKRAAIKPPDEIPLDKPKESDAPLAAANDTGPVDGFTDGVEGGTGNGHAPPPPPPPPKAEPLIRPVEMSGNERPKYPKAALRKGIEGVVVVMLEILENGHVGSAKIISGPPEFHETVLEMAHEWRFKPATRGGVPVRYKLNKQVRFRLEDA